MNDRTVTFTAEEADEVEKALAERVRAVRADIRLTASRTDRNFVIKDLERALEKVRAA